MFSQSVQLQFKNNFECCSANSVYIVDNIIYEFETLGKKRKRDHQQKIKKEKLNDNDKLDEEKSSESEENLGFIDKSGKIILKNLFFNENWIL